MRIFSNFDTKFKEKLYNEFKSKYGEENVILITRCKYFLWFNVLIPLFFLEIGYIILWILFYLVDLGELNSFKWSMYVFLFVLGHLIIWGKIFKKFIDYKMDFAVITPEEIISYNQTGIFSRSSRSLDVDKIKTISVDKKWLLRSIFNFGSIIFLSEWDDTWHWDIELKFVASPEKLEEKITRIIWYWKFNNEISRFKQEYKKNL